MQWQAHTNIKEKLSFAQIDAALMQAYEQVGMTSYGADLSAHGH